MHDLKVWVGVEADGSSTSTTPGKSSGQLDEMSRVAKVLSILHCCGVSCNVCVCVCVGGGVAVPAVNVVCLQLASL